MLFATPNDLYHFQRQDKLLISVFVEAVWANRHTGTLK